MNLFLTKYGKVISGLALLVAVVSANSTCLFYLHQPELPESASKLRKF